MCRVYLTSWKLITFWHGEQLVHLAHHYVHSSLTMTLNGLQAILFFDHNETWFDLDWNTTE